MGHKRVGDVETSHVMITLSFSSVNFAKSFISQKLEKKKKKETLIGTRIWDFLSKILDTNSLCVFFSSIYGVNYKL